MKRKHRVKVKVQWLPTNTSLSPSIRIPCPNEDGADDDDDEDNVIDNDDDNNNEETAMKTTTTMLTTMTQYNVACE